MTGSPTAGANKSREPSGVVHAMLQDVAALRAQMETLRSTLEHQEGAAFEARASSERLMGINKRLRGDSMARHLKLTREEAFCKSP